METIEDIVREMREHHVLTTAPCACWVLRKDELIYLLDRIEAAYRHDHECAVEERAVLEGEIAKLKAALKPVLDYSEPWTMGEAERASRRLIAINEAKSIYDRGEK